MISDGWVKKEREKEFSIETLTIEFDKAVKKAKLEEQLGGSKAGCIRQALVKEGSKDLYVLNRIPEIIAKARSLAGDTYHIKIPKTHISYRHNEAISALIKRP